jgi:membrane peptidoglycan carboxypeptidase
MPVVTGSSAVVDSGVSYFDSLPGELQESPLMQTTTMLSAIGQPIAYFYDENRIEVPLSKVATVLQQAIVAIEDSRFFPLGIHARGAIRRSTTRPAAAPGASTTQQYVKNVPWNARSRAMIGWRRNATWKNTARKVREMRIAIAVEKRLTRQQIRALLNIATSVSIYGVQAAALQYFGVPVSRGPSRRPAGRDAAGAQHEQPETVQANALARRDVVLGRMLQLKLITLAEHDTRAPRNPGGGVVGRCPTDARIGGIRLLRDYVMLT